MYLQEVEAVGAAGGIFLNGLVQVLPIFHLTASEYLGHVGGHLFIAPVQLIDVCVVRGLNAFVSVLWPRRRIKNT